MIIDLAVHHRSAILATSVLIVGAGIAGLLLASKLRQYGVRVVIIESGGREQKEETHPLNRVVTAGDHYRGALHGRFRCLGGTSTRWGGALIPFLPEDLCARPYIGLSAWPVNIDAVEPYLVDIEKLFGVKRGSYDEEFVQEIGAESLIPIRDEDFIARFAKWPRFKFRNIATLLKDRIERDPDLSIWINATVTHFELNEQGRLRSITAQHQGGNTVVVTAATIVLCAGAIESTRLLLLLDREYRGQVFRDCRALGRFFHDHLSAKMASINAKQIRKLNRMAAIRFTGSTMRSLRFELSPHAQTEERVTSAFGHISFQAQKSTGFEELRELLRAVQRSGHVQPGLAARALRDLPYLTKTGLWRYIYKQLYWPAPATYELHIVAEQPPRADNCIKLAWAEMDIFGLPLAAIKWRIEPADCRVFSAYIRRFDRFWKRRGLQAIGDLEWSSKPDSLCPNDILQGGDIYHPGGSTRMGADAQSAVVDDNLRAYAVPNLWVLSTSVFPSGASANPTLMLMLFAMRLAERLATAERTEITSPGS